VECCRGKRSDWTGGASVRDPSLNLPQGEIDNRLRINQPIARLHRSEEAVVRGVGKEWWAKKISQR
jgi:hypothetical protein